MDREGPPEHAESLWMLIVGPTVWALHFLLCYITAALWCAKVSPPPGALGGARIAIALYTLLALAAIGVYMVSAHRRHEFGEGTLPHDYDTAADRHRFLGFAGMLLAGLSFVSTLFVGGVAWFFGSCA